MPLKMIELFSGAGLLGHSFSKNGFEPVLAIDSNFDAVQTYNHNARRPAAIVHDVNDIVEIEADLIVAGPPCQGFSTLGARNKKDARNKLSLELFHWANSSNASVVVIENVPQFLDSPQFKTLCRNMRKLKYDCAKWVLKAQEYSAPQNRSRSFSIFSRIGLPKKPETLDGYVSVSEAFEGLIENGVDHLHFTPPMTELSLARIRNVPKAGGKLDLLKSRPDLCPESWVKLGCQATDVWGRMDATKPSNTIRCSFQNPSKGRYIHPTLDRVITLREGARLQGIPDHWKFIGARTSVTRQIGNGVPIPLGNAVAVEVAKLF